MKKMLFVAALLCASAGFANVRPAKIFSDSMVIQRGMKTPVWGWADPNEKVTVRFKNQEESVITGADGCWKIWFSGEQAGGPYDMVIQGNNKVVLKNILVGDVWICSGQSNMEWTVSNSNNPEGEIAAANYPMIRHIKINNAVGQKPWDDIGNNSGWRSAVPANVANFTAVGYFFARELYRQTQVPIGLINSSWGGTDVETWTSREAFENSDEFKQMIAQIPSLNLDSLADVRQKEQLASLVKIQGGLPDNTVISQWKTDAFDHSQWPRMRVPGLWEQSALPGFDGVVWLRKTIEVSAADAGKAAELFLGVIDDNDETYVNGIQVGSTNAYNVSRKYSIRAGILKQGKNTIVIRVEDSGGGGGLYGAASDLQLVIDGHSQPLAGEWSFQVESIFKSNAVGPNTYPTLLYNAMIHPLIPFAIKGAIWYQGESNAGRAYQYRKAFPLMITDWRNRWGQGNFPFYFVQLSSFNSGNGNSERGSSWAELREAQTMTLSLPNTGMAVTTDIGNAKDIHPRNKQDVGKRLAAIALHELYGKDNIVYSGPLYESMSIEGDKIVLSFRHTGSGLFATAGGIKGFEIAGADKKFYPATAVIEGDKIIVYSDKVKSPEAVHYAWADDAGEANLFNREGFPAVPFRTDQWKGITEAAKYRK